MNKRKLAKLVEEEGLDLYQRQYLLTHNDATSELLVHVGRAYGPEDLGPQRDELIFKWDPDQSILHGYCFVENPNSRFPVHLRKEIFQAHFLNSFLAIIKVEEDFNHDQAKFELRGHYIFSDQSLNEYQSFGYIDQVLFNEQGQLIDFGPGYDYSQLKKK